jgi:hypothetical protein
MLDKSFDHSVDATEAANCATGGSRTFDLWPAREK